MNPARRRGTRVILVVSVLALTALLIAPQTPSAQAEAGWRFKLVPYLWVPSINSTIRYPIPGSSTGGTVDAEIGVGDYIDNLSLALLLAGEARRGRAVFVTDLFYTEFSSEKSGVRSVDFSGRRVPVSAGFDAGTTSSLETLVWTLVGGYALVVDSTGTAEVVGGFRYARSDVQTDWRLTTTITRPGGTETFPASGSVGTTVDAWDAVVGVHGSFPVGKGGFFAPYYVDIGTGASDLTWQIVLGLGYAFDPVDGILVYRHLEYAGGESDAMQELSFSGVAIGAAFRF
jgi:hypothetical protein